ncbi:MAG: hypothetical protein HW389_1853, partial [Bacteroidetes bacterium]|nr:hypothetical protein [Bacteroidota bacterium]
MDDLRQGKAGRIEDHLLLAETKAHYCKYNYCSRICDEAQIQIANLKVAGSSRG